MRKKPQTAAEEIRAELEAIQAERAKIEQATREILARVRMEILQSNRELAEVQVELTARRAWRKTEEQQ